MSGETLNKIQQQTNQFPCHQWCQGPGMCALRGPHCPYLGGPGVLSSSSKPQASGSSPPLLHSWERWRTVLPTLWGLASPAALACPLASAWLELGGLSASARQNLRREARHGSRSPLRDRCQQLPSVLFSPLLASHFLFFPHCSLISPPTTHPCLCRSEAVAGH